MTGQKNQNLKKELIFKPLKSSLLIRAVLLLITCVSATAAIAQKSSGTLELENTGYTSAVSTVDDEVTQAVAQTGGEVRFLIKPIREAQIFASMSGTVNKLHYKVGQRFRIGQPLISLNCAEIEARYEAQASRVKQQKLTYQADKQLLEGNAVSKFTVLQSEAKLEEEVAILKERNVARRRCKIRAPFSGGVVSVDINQHEAVSSQEPLMKIIDDSGLVMSLNVPSSFVNRIKRNDRFTVDVDETGKTYQAKVTGVSPMIDPISKTIELRASLVEGLSELTPGMSGKANLDFVSH